MQEQLLYLRGEHGEVFATKLPTGQIIPWRPLSMGEFIKYDDAFRAGSHPRVCLEDEIFKKCVLDSALVKGINEQKAGIVSTVVVNIMNYSGPQSVEDLNQVLGFSRQIAIKALNELVTFVCQAFPAYKPEDVYEMDYTTFMLRVAQSEKKMLGTGFITEPLVFEHPAESAEQQAQTKQQTKDRRKQNSEMLDRYYENQGIEIPNSIKQARADLREKIIDHPKPPSLPIPTEERTIITMADVIEHQAVLSGHDKDVVYQHKATDETAQVYDNYLKDLAQGKKLKILTPEERKVAAKERMERNRLTNIKRQSEALEAAKQELPELLKARDEARKRKAKKAARRR